MKRGFAWLGTLSRVLLLAATSSHAFEAPLSAEDASGRVERWYFSEANRHFKNAQVWQEIQHIANEHQITLVSLGSVYEWVQDAALFDERGRFLKPAAYQGEDELFGLTLGISRAWDESPDQVPYFLESEAIAESSSLSVSFPEGGALISGRLQSGEAYVLAGGHLVLRAQRHLTRLEGRPYSFQEAHERVARDLRVSPELLIELPSRGHLDLQVLALPGGVVLIHDPSLVAPRLKTLLHEASDSERQRLQRMISLYEGTLMGASKPYDDETLLYVERLERILSKHLRVIRVAGVFLESQEERPRGLVDRINFFNGFQGRDASGRFWQLTNRAEGLGVIERWWKRLMQELLQEDAHVYFPGIYSLGAGIDCSGALSAGSGAKGP